MTFSLSGLSDHARSRLPTKQAGASVGVVGNRLPGHQRRRRIVQQVRARDGGLGHLQAGRREVLLTSWKDGTERRQSSAQDRVWVAAGSGGGEDECGVVHTLRSTSQQGCSMTDATGALDPWSSVVEPLVEGSVGCSGSFGFL